MRKGKVTFVHAGVERLSDNVLKLMRKGVTGLGNVQLLKWCREAGIKASCMVLSGIPGAPPRDYSQMANLVPLILHLDPPLRLQFVELHRFSPMFNEPKRFGAEATYLSENSIHVYPEGILTPNLTYCFQFLADGKRAGVHPGLQAGRGDLVGAVSGAGQPAFSGNAGRQGFPADPRQPSW